MKRTIQKLVSLLLVVITCFSLLPTDAFAWGKMTHVYTANLIKKDSDDGSSSVFFGEEEGEKTFRYTVPEEYLEAIREYPDAFRAGALGPDMYPDIITGQTYIHPEDENIDSGEWVTLLCDAVNKMGKDTPGRKQALSFTLGCMLHYCGDLFGHDFVNTYSGGTFPSLFSSDILDLKGERINNILSHLSVEKYMDSLLYPDYDESDGRIDAPDSFVTNAMVFDGTPAAGLAAPYAKYPAFEISLDEVESEPVKKVLEELFGTDSNNVPPHYTALLALREYVTSVADEYRENMEPVSAAITAYCDAWADDVDRGIVAFTRACDNIARRMVTREKNPDIEKKKQEAVDDEKNYFIKLLQDPDVMFFWDKISKEQNEKLKAAGIYGDSFFDLVLVELLSEGIISLDMLTNKENSSLTIIKEELNYWTDEYGVYMLGIPDIIIDGIEIPVIGDIVDLLLLQPVWDMIGYEIKKVAADYIVSTLTGTVTDYTGLSGQAAGKAIAEQISKMNDRLEDPRLQLDHGDNPYKPSENNFAQLEEDLKSLPDEVRYSIPDSNLASLYNTLTMFKLVLMGPENYSKFTETYAGVKQTSYQKNTACLEASALRLEIQTSDLYLSGTDDNIYAVVYRLNADGSKTELTSKLLDKSGYNDFENGDKDTYLVELPESVKLTELEIGLSKMPAFTFLPSLTDDWCCENIRVTPLYANYELTEPIDLGGIHLKGICNPFGMNFQTALKAGRDQKAQKSVPVTNLKVQIKVSGSKYAGSDSDIYLAAYYGNRLWAKVCLDKALYNDLERNDNDTYVIPVTALDPDATGIPLNELKLRFVHDGIDQANWERVTVTPCYGALELTEPIDLGGKKFEDSTWKTSFATKVKKASCKQYAPLGLEYKTCVDDGLLFYMDSLDGGEEWVDGENELWANTTLRKKIFLELFHGFAPEIVYTGEATALEGDPVAMTLELRGVWNGVSCDRRASVKDFKHVYAVEGSAELVLYNEKGEAVYTCSDVAVAGGDASHEIPAGKLKPGYYDLKVRYESKDADPTYGCAEETFEKALQVIAVEPLEIKNQPKNATARIGDTVSFTIEVQGGRGPYTYKWQISEGNSPWRDADASRGNGFDRATFTFTVRDDEFYTGYGYRCVVTDADGKTVTGNTVAVLEKTEPLAILTQPKNITASAGGVANFVVAVTGGKAPYTYKWQVAAGNSSWRDADGSWSIGYNADAFSFSVRDDQFYIGYEYRCVITDAAGKSVTSKTVTVLQKAQPLAVRIEDGGREIEYNIQSGQKKTLTANVTGGTGPYTYTWYTRLHNRDPWEKVSSEATYVLLPSMMNSFTVVVEVTDAAGNTVKSDTVYINVTGVIIN